ncbi:hypothetical protein [Aquamicrobium soli]|jgi:hypothetical protein|uniref:DUF3606 domain-containing protein n=1 Tax=Aquamicrobium soli TaxID=1811518 RepID=A0ABV7K574_9HYPH
MTNDKNERDFRDSATVFTDDEVERFARENGVAADEVRILIEQYGNERVFLVQAAKDLRERSSEREAADQVTREARQQQARFHLDKPTDGNG